MSLNEVADNLVRQFDRMVRGDGGSLKLVSAADNLITVAYNPAAAPSCEEGVCQMPHLELQTMMAETLGRRDPAVKLKVVLEG